MFPSTGKCGHLRRIDRSFKALLQRAEIAPALPHDLRHTVAQAALDSGVDFAVVGALLGHSRGSLGTTGIYAAPSLDRQRAALQRAVNHLLSADQGKVVQFG